MEIGLDPVAFTIDLPLIGAHDVRWYSIFVTLAVIMLILWVWYFLKREGIKSEYVMGAALWTIPMAVIVARLVHVVDNFDYFTDDPIKVFGGAGLAIYGAILGGLLGAYIYCRIKGLSFAPLADIGAPGILLAQAVGRVGCIFNGCCYGKETSLPWAFTYTNPASEAPQMLPVHPTQLYELIGDLFLFALLFWVFRGRLKPSGSLLALYLALYSALTFTVRFWRGDTEPFAGPIHEGQLISVLVAVLAIGWMIVHRTHWVQRQPEQIPVRTEEPHVV